MVTFIKFEALIEPSRITPYLSVTLTTYWPEASAARHPVKDGAVLVKFTTKAGDGGLKVQPVDVEDDEVVVEELVMLEVVEEVVVLDVVVLEVKEVEVVELVEDVEALVDECPPWVVRTPPTPTATTTTAMTAIAAVILPIASRDRGCIGHAVQDRRYLRRLMSVGCSPAHMS